MSIPSYTSIYNLGHKAIADLFKGPVVIEEKVDGSQFSFGLIETTPGEYEPRCRSKGAEINMIAPEGMFKAGVEFVKSIENLLVPGWVYRGEYLRSPKHNCLVYDRTPKNHIIIFDIMRGEEDYLSEFELISAASKLGLETVPLLFSGMVTDVTMLRSFLEHTSILGGQKIEGMVIKPKNRDLFGRDKKLLMGKFVSEAFKEVHANDWKKEHKTPTNNEIVSILAGMYATPARWAKALIHLREASLTEGSMRDIPALMAEVPADVLGECEAAIRDQLFDWAWPQLRRALTKGLPLWYKDVLAMDQFKDKANAEFDRGEALDSLSDEAAPQVPSTCGCIEQGFQVPECPQHGLADAL